MSNHSDKPFDPTKPVIVSPGPTSIEGKAISSKNAIRHGCTSETLILADETMEDYKALEAIWLDSYKPKDKAERHLLDELVTADWFLARATRRYNEVEICISERSPNPCYWDESDHRLITRFTRYRTAHANSVARHKKMLEDYRKARLAESNNEVKLAHDEVKLKVYQEKNKPELTVEEIIAGMQKRAAALGFPPPTPPQK